MNCNLNEMPMLGLLGVTTHGIFNAAKTMFRELDMNRSKASILFSLRNRDAISQKELADLLNVSAPSITSSIQKMEKEGYIIRTPDRQDQRVMRLSLTEKGRACIQSVVDVGERMEEIVFQGMTLEEKLLFRRLLIHANENMQEYERKQNV